MHIANLHFPTKQRTNCSNIARKGKRIARAEITAYHPGVDVYWQENAWADTKTSVEWIDRTLKPAIETGTGVNEFLLFVDNLKAQTSGKFRTALHDISGVKHYGVSGATDTWQPVDCGIGRILKNLVSREQDEWLEFYENIELWLGNTKSKLNASKRRILITYWVADVYEKLMGGEYANSLYRSIEKSGCLITANGSDDSMINPEGLPGYILPPPTVTYSRIRRSDTMRSTATMKKYQMMAMSTPYVYNTMRKLKNEEDEEDDSLPDRIDDVKDRVRNHPLKQREVKVLFYEEWHIGQMTYCNKVLEY